MANVDNSDEKQGDDLPLKRVKQGFSGRVHRTRFFTCLIMLGERFLINLSSFFLWTGIFAVGYLFFAADLTDHTLNLVSILYYFGAIGLLIHGIRKCKWPRLDDIDARIETSNNLQHRPLSFLRDRLSNPYSRTTRDLWNKQALISQHVLNRIGLPFPNIGWAGKDRFAVRGLLLILLIIGTVTSGESWEQRLKHGFVPNIAASLFPNNKPVTLWVTAPEYTRVERQIFEANNESQTINVPENSQFKIRVNAIISTPTFSINGKKVELTHVGGDAYEFEGDIVNDTTLRVSQYFLTRGNWNVKAIQDTRPTIVARKEPQETELQGLRFPITVGDDYGVHHLEFALTPAPVMIEPPLGEPLSVTRIVASTNGEIDVQPIFDLTDHSWAGLPVVLSLTAVDYKDQKSEAYEVEITLPEREFEHPIAQKLVDYRKTLAWTPELSAPEIVRQLETLLLFPEEMQNDNVVYLGIKTAASRLENNPSIETTSAVIDLLWNLALRLEDGNLTLARRALEDAQRDVTDISRDPEATQEDIEDSIDELNTALNNYLQELSRELLKNQEDDHNIPRISPELLDETLDPERLGQFLDDLEKNIINKNQNKTDELLSQLQDLMDMLDPSLAETLPENVQGMIAGVNELQELIENLRDLKFLTEQLAKEKETFSGTVRPQRITPFEREEQTFPPLAKPDKDILKDWGLRDFPPPPQMNPNLVPTLPSPHIPKTPKTAKKDLPMPDHVPNKQKELMKKSIPTTPPEYVGKSEEQKAMRYVLGQVMKDTGDFFGEIPENMGEAEFLMRDAEDLLFDENATNAVPKQQEAIDKLMEAQQQLADQLEEMLQEGTETAMGPGTMDPLGRQQPGQGQAGGSNDGGLLGSFVEIPEESQRRYIQEILRKLREKAGELERPKVERDYIDRLLEKF